MKVGVSGWGRVGNLSVCLYVCLCVDMCVCVCVDQFSSGGVVIV